MARRRRKQPESFMDLAAGPAAFAGLIIVVLGFAAWAVVEKINLYVYAVFALGLVLFAVALAAKPTEVAGFFKSRQTKLGANALVMMLAFLGIIVMVNWVAYRRHGKIDLTKNKLHTLAPQTTKILRGLGKTLKKKDEVVKITAFYSSSGPGSQDFMRIKDLLEQYEDVNPKKVKFRMVDPLLRPGIAEQMGVTSLSTTVVSCTKTDKEEKVNYGDEQDFTSALLKVTKAEKKKFYFLQGHGEHKWDGYDDDGLSTLKTALEKQNHECAELNLMSDPSIPDDCTALIICGPQKRLLDEERDLLRDYLEEKGRVLIMIDPPKADSEGELLSDILSRWGVTPSGNITIEPANNIWGDATLCLATDFPFHEITKPLKGASASMLFLATNLELDETEPPPSQYGQPPESDKDYEVKPLLKSSSSSWGVAQLKTQDDLEKRLGSGPFNLAAVVTSGAPKPPPQPGMPPPPPDDDEEKTRIVVIADSDMATNKRIRSLANGDFVLNALNWLAEESELISIQPKDKTKNAITLSESQQTLAALLSKWLLPFGCLIAGVLVWWRRR